jgi:hypothetical protein
MLMETVMEATGLGVVALEVIVTTVQPFAAKVAKIVTSTVSGTARMIVWILMATDMA